jgi:hypothetical protein
MQKALVIPGSGVIGKNAYISMVLVTVEKGEHVRTSKKTDPSSRHGSSSVRISPTLNDLFDPPLLFDHPLALERVLRKKPF